MKSKKPSYTPVMLQYLNIKKRHPDTIILFRLGDFYEMFFDDAVLVSRELSLVLTARHGGGEERVPMCGVPFHALKTYLAKLIDKGYKVGIVEQLEDPKDTKGLVDRDVVQIVTPGTYMDLDSINNNFILAIDVTEFNYVVAACDISTGELLVQNVEHDDAALLSAIDHFQAREIVVNSDFSAATAELLKTMRQVILSFEKNDKITFEYEGLLTDVQDIFQMRVIARLLHYLEATQKRSLSYLKNAQLVNQAKVMMIDGFSRVNLELTRTQRSDDKYGSLYWLLDVTKTAMGARLLKNWINAPSVDINEIDYRHKVLSTMIVNFLTRDELQKLLNQVYDLERLIARIAYGNANARDLLQLKNSIGVLPSIKQKLQHLDNPVLNRINDRIDPLVSLFTELEKAIDLDAPITIKEGGIFKQGYSADLDELLDIAHNSKHYLANFELAERERTGIKNLKIGFNRVFGYYIEVSNSNLPMIKDEFGYIRKQTTKGGERFITSALKEKEVLILNSEDRQKALEYNLFVDLRNRIQPLTTTIQNNAHAIAELDALISLATVSVKNGFVQPTFNSNRVIEIIGGKHPVIDKVIKQSRFVANDTIMGPDVDVMLITGPNMGGKSTYMRQVAIIAIMAQIGCFVPAKSANLMLFDQIFTRIGASDDLVSGQSTFMVEMSETNFALRHATANSLLIFDEIGRGTSTFDGMALAQAIIEYITSRLGAKTLFSTHYHELTQIDQQISSVKNVHVEVKEEADEVTFLYRVRDGAMNKSYGINVARLASLPLDLLVRAQEILSTLEMKEIPFSTEVLAQKPVIEEAWINQVRAIDPLSMTPLEALNFLYDLKKKM